MEDHDSGVQLESIHLFSGLGPAQIARVRQGMRRLRLDEGQRLFDHGQHADRFFYVAEGQIKLYRLSPEGAEKVIEIVRPGETFAEAVMFMERQDYPVSAEAISAACVYSFDSRNFMAVLRESVDTCFRVMADMSMRLRARLNEINALTLQNATLRMVGYLARHLPADAHNGASLELPAPKNVIASRLSIQPETLSRILHNLSKSGIISVEGKVIHVHDVERLRGQM